MNLVDVVLEDDLTFPQLDLAITKARGLLKSDPVRVRMIGAGVSDRFAEHLERYKDGKPQALVAGWTAAARYAEAASVGASMERDQVRAVEHMRTAEDRYDERLRSQKSRRRKEPHIFDPWNGKPNKDLLQDFYYWLGIAELERGEAALKREVVRTASPEDVIGVLESDAASYGKLLFDPISYVPSSAIETEHADLHLRKAWDRFTRNPQEKARRQLGTVRMAQAALKHYSSL